MSFTKGFSKTAGLPGIIGATAGTARRAGRAAAKGIGTAVEKSRAELGQSYRSAAAGKEKPLLGETLLKKRLTKQMPTAGVSEKQEALEKGIRGSRSAVKERAQRIEDVKKKKGLSFAEKHPLLTAGALYGGYKAMTREPDQSDQPQIYRPQ